MPLTYTLSKDADTGDITIRYSDSTGFPVHFSWTTVIRLDGASATMPIAPPPNSSASVISPNLAIPPNLPHPQSARGGMPIQNNIDTSQRRCFGESLRRTV